MARTCTDRQLKADQSRALLLVFGYPVVEEFLARRFRAAQISSIVRLTPFSVLAIVSAVIALAHNLGLEVSAEGVERRFQIDALRALGCDKMQGSFFERPEADPAGSAAA